MLPKTFYFIWAFFWIIGLHYFQRGLSGTGLELSFNNITWIFVSLSICSVCFYICSKKYFAYNKTCCYLIITFLALNIPYLYPFITDFSFLPLTSESFGRFCGLFAGLLFFLALSQLPKNPTTQKQLIDCILTGTIIESLITLAQLFFLDVNSFIPFLETSRPYGVFNQVNVAATFFATGLALSLYRLYLRKELKEESTIALCFILTSTVLASLSIILTGSRTGLISIILIFLIGIFANYRYTNKQTGKQWAFCVLLGVTLAYSCLSLQTKAIEPLDKITHLGLRSTLYTNSFNMIGDHPFKGWGYGNFEWAYLNYSVSDKGVPSPLPEHIPPFSSSEHPHNELLYWGVEGGLLPIVAIILFSLYFLFQLRHAQYSIILFLVCLPLALHSLLELPFYHSAPSWLLFLFSIWLGDTGRYTYQKVYCPFIIKSLSTTAYIVTIIFMLANLHAIFLYNKFRDNRNVSYLSQALNPIGISDNYTYVSIALEYKQAVNANIQSTSDNLIERIKDFLPYNPDPRHFRRIIHLLLNENRPIEANEFLEEHNRLFPLYKITIDGKHIKEVHSNKIVATILQPRK